MADRTALSSGATPEYANAMMKYLGDREPLESLAAAPADVRRAVAGLTKPQSHTPEAPGKWSVAAVVQHLADVEIVLGFRFRKVLGEPGTPIPAIDQDLWADRLNYLTTDVPGALDDYDALRRVNLRLLRTVTPEQWNLFGIHEQRGKETIEYMVRLYAAHDRYHLYQIDRIRKAIGA